MSARRVAVLAISYVGALFVCPRASEAQLWRRTLGSAAAYAVAVRNGDPIAAGYLTGGAVVRFDGATGQPVWQNEVGGTQAGSGAFLALTLDSAGDPIAAGGVYNLGSSLDIAVAKLDGDDGTLLWKWETASAGDSGEVARAVAVDDADDVAVAGELPEGSYAALKLSGADGSELWRYATGGTFATDIAYDAAGDVVVAGQGFVVSPKLTVVKLAGSTGALVWRVDLPFGLYGLPPTLAVDGTGDVIAGAFGGVGAVVKLAGADGTVIWQVENLSARDVVVDSAGDVFVAGAGMKLSGATGAVLWTADDQFGAPDCSPPTTTS
ncbi:MAG TPA: PQQ-binding-like beta-propeller repeat protein [Candidatus Binatia bacterium]|nr:PQQ-binding-like beta-propeller repeat protein [Candidatus Binatia bacterium]